MNTWKYKEFDQAVSKSIMNEFRGRIIAHNCDECTNGKTLIFNEKTGRIEWADCDGCFGTGIKKIKY